MIKIDSLQMITGIDIPIPSLGITIKQPRMKEIALMGESNYFVALSISQVSRERLKIPNPEISNWMIFQQTLKQQLPGVVYPSLFMTNFFQLFLNEKVMIAPTAIVIEKSEGQFISIEGDSFDLFQEVIGKVGGAELINKQDKKDEFRPANARAAEIAEKMKKAKQKREAAMPKSKSDGFLERYIRSVVIATSNTLEDVNNMTIHQLNHLFQTYINYENYNLEVKSRLAGAKDDNKLIHWISRPLGEQNDENDSVGKLDSDAIGSFT